MSKKWKFLRSRGAENCRAERQSAERSLSSGFELLEDRLVLSADGLLPLDVVDTQPAIISPIWFEQLSTSALTNIESGSSTLEESTERLAWKDRSLDVYSNEWIVQLDWSALTESTTITEASNLFAIEDVGFEIIGGLGLGGQLLIRTADDVIVSQIDDWLGGSAVVQHYEPNALLPIEQTPDDSSYSQLWGLNNTGQTGGTVDADIDAPEAWNISTGSSNIVVAVIDTGIDYTHPDLAANIWTNPGEIAGNGIDDDGNGFIDDVHGYDFVNNDGDPMDDHGHGTHVAGTIAGVGDNGTGVTGVNWQSSVMALKFLSASGSGSIANAIKAVNYATMMKTSYGVNLKATNNSWGGGGYSQAMSDAITASGNADILFIAAAGNSSNNNDASPHYPSTYTHDNVIAVAATDHNDNLAYFSSYGATTVDLAAPGVSTYSTVPGGGYASFSGTSMATPHVTGVAALAWSVNPNATAAQIKAAILGGVDTLSSLNGKVLTAGRLNAFNTLQSMGMSVSGSSIVDGSTLSTQPTDYTIDFTFAYDSASLNSSDFQVNGISANSFTLVDSDTITFHYNVSPVTAEGTQTMQIAQGAITRAGTGQGVNAWQSEFFYDQQVLSVISSTPTLGEVLSSAPLYIDLNFNEAVDAASIDASDLVLSAGSVLAVTAFDADTVRFTVTGLPSDGPVSYSLAAGALSDIAGSPGAEFSGNFVIDNPLVERYTSTGPVQIVDNATVTSTINVTDSLKIVDLNVELDISHTYDWDLQVYVISPNGTRVQLFSSVGGSGDNFSDTVLDDEASTSISSGSAPFTGMFRPAEMLSAYDGVSVAGVWTLEVTDIFSVDNGWINSWSIVVENDGMSVVTSDPGGGKTINTARTDFTVDFSIDVDAATLDASDFTIDGAAADSFTLVDSDTVTFHYNVSPYSTDGSHVMAIAAGAVSSSAGLASIAWQDNFFFDQLALGVTSTNVADGGTIVTPPTFIEFNFNEAIDPASIQVGDLQLSAGTVTGVTVVDADTIRFDVSIPNYDMTVTYTIASGAITDAAGTPNAEFTRSFTIDDPTILSYSSGVIDASLPDLGSTNFYINVAEDYDILDINVNLDISHTWDSDLDVYLISPDGKIIELFTDVGGSGDNFTGTVLDDEANVAITSATAPFSGRFRAEGLLSAVDGDSAKGIWTLQVGDDFSDDTGVLHSWGMSIHVNLPPVVASIADQTMSYSDGSISVPIMVTDGNGDSLTLTAEVVSGSTQAYDLDQQYGFYVESTLLASNLYENYWGAGEKFFWAANTSGSQWYFILPSGEVHQWGGSIAGSPLIATLDSSFHEDPSLLYDAQAASNAPVTLSLDQQTNVLTITPQAGFLGEFNVRVTASDGMDTGVQTFHVNVTNQTPLIGAIADQSMSYNDGSIIVPIMATDGDGDAITLTAEVSSGGSSQAYDLDQQYGFYVESTLLAANLYENFWGAGEKFFWAANTSGSQWYFILPNGEVHQWGGSIAGSPLIATLDSSFHADPSLLYDAQPASNAQVTLSLDQQTGMLTIIPQAGYLGDFSVKVTASDGVSSSEQTFNVGVTNQAPLITAISNQTMSYSDGSIIVPIMATDGDGDTITLTASVGSAGSSQAYDLDQQYGFYVESTLLSANLYENYWGAGEKFFWAANTSGSQWYFVLPSGEVHQWGGSIAGSPLIATLDSSFHTDPSLLYDAQPANNAQVTLSLDQQTGMLTITPQAGYLGDFSVKVTASDGVSQTEQSFSVSVTNLTPTINAIPDQSMTTLDGSIIVPIMATDGDGDAITLSANVIAGSTEAYDLDQQYGFYVNSTLLDNNLYENYWGSGEKFFWAANTSGSQWYFILPSGEVHQWGGSIAGSPLIAALDSSFHADPSLLYDAQPAGAPVTLSLDQQTGLLTITPQTGFVGDFNVTVSATDGVSNATQTFAVSVTSGVQSVESSRLELETVAFMTSDAVQVSSLAPAVSEAFYYTPPTQRIVASIKRDQVVSKIMNELDFSKSSLVANPVDDSSAELERLTTNRDDSSQNDHQHSTTRFEAVADEVYSWLGDDDDNSSDLDSLDDLALGVATLVP